MELKLNTQTPGESLLDPDLFIVDEFGFDWKLSGYINDSRTIRRVVLDNSFGPIFGIYDRSLVSQGWIFLEKENAVKFLTMLKRQSFF
jgi:hypothetical protein